jgi:hypothetical protein
MCPENRVHNTVPFLGAAFKYKPAMQAVLPRVSVGPTQHYESPQLILALSGSGTEQVPGPLQISAHQGSAEAA